MYIDEITDTRIVLRMPAMLSLMMSAFGVVWVAVVFSGGLATDSLVLALRGVFSLVGFGAICWGIGSWRNRIWLTVESGFVVLKPARFFSLMRSSRVFWRPSARPRVVSLQVPVGRSGSRPRTTFFVVLDEGEIQKIEDLCRPDLPKHGRDRVIAADMSGPEAKRVVTWLLANSPHA